MKKENLNSDASENESAVKTAVVSVAEKEALVGLVRSVNRLNRVIFVLALGLVIASVIAALGYYRRPKVLVAVQTPDGQRIAQIDDIKFGATEQIQMGEENLTDRDKEYLVNQFLESFYGVDLASRSRDVPKALSMMIPASAQTLYKSMNEQGFLQRERDEGWSASWKTESFEVDRNDKNLAQIIGTQILRRNFGGKIKQERVQYKIQFQLYTEGKREESPLRTGYWIATFKAEELTRSETN